MQALAIAFGEGRSFVSMCRRSSRSDHKCDGSVGSRPRGVPVFRLRPFPICRCRRCVAFHPWRAPRRRNDCRDRRCRRTPRRVLGQSIGAGLAIVDVDGRDGDFFHKRRIGVSTDMGLEAMNRWFALCLTQRPSSSSSLAEAMIVALTSAPVFTWIALALSWPVISSNRALSRPWATKGLSKTYQSRSLRSRL